MKIYFCMQEEWKNFFKKKLYRKNGRFSKNRTVFCPLACLPYTQPHIMFIHSFPKLTPLSDSIGCAIYVYIQYTISIFMYWIGWVFSFFLSFFWSCQWHASKPCDPAVILWNVQERKEYDVEKKERLSTGYQMIM